MPDYAFPTRRERSASLHHSANVKQRILFSPLQAPKGQSTPVSSVIKFDRKRKSSCPGTFGIISWLWHIYDCLASIVGFIIALFSIFHANYAKKWKTDEKCSINSKCQKPFCCLKKFRLRLPSWTWGQIQTSVTTKGLGLILWLFLMTTFYKFSDPLNCSRKLTYSPLLVKPSLVGRTTF